MNFGPPPSDSDSDDYDGMCFGYDSDKEKKKNKHSHVSPIKKDPLELIKDNLSELIKHKNVDEFKKIFDENRSLINANEPLKKNNWPPLMLACQSNCFEIVEYLINSLSANVNQVCDYWSPLMVICSAHHDNNDELKKSILNIVHLLIENKASTNVRNRYGETPLMLAISQGHIDAVKLILKQDVSLEACDNEGNTALFYAIMYNQIEIVKMLIERKVLMDIRNRNGDKPKDVAISKGFDEINALFPNELQVPVVPFECKTYNSIEELIPFAYPEYERTAYMPDVFTLLRGMESSRLEYLFYNEKINLVEFLTTTDKRLEEIGIKFPYQRKRILLGLMKFHVAKYSRNSLPKPLNNSNNIDLISLFDIVAACAKHLVILKSSMDFIQRNDIFGIEVAKPEHFVCFNSTIKKIEHEVDVMTNRIKSIQNGMSLKPPIHIDEETIAEFKNKISFRRQIKKTLWIGGTVFTIATLIVIRFTKIRQ